MLRSLLVTRDFVAGCLFVVLGLAFLWGGFQYSFGTVKQMGPGYFPVVLALLLIALGFIVALKGFVATGEPISGLNVRGIVFVLGATLAFGLLMRPAGLLISVFVLAAIGAIASAQSKIKGAALLAAGLSAFCVLGFCYALGMPFAVFGYWFR
ncbi:tripartite tricarboxylate transporter TctB family protein [Rhizobium sp. Root708]|uniref:tripartite tricarboxylate transporter TctB family protein n=1 Tax=Rhizobium sp. Root708 TaxID=1736592 RepID=UPI0009EC721D|nr:tripartite tricarboxylate transporter TctB family protein [Rhizobium sp. Root708]